MKPYSLTSSGGYVKSYLKYGAPYGDVTFIPLAKETVSLSCTSMNGDFHNPNPFSFDKVHSQYLKGSFSEYDYPWVNLRSGDGCGGGPLNAALANTASALDPYNKCLGKLFDQLRSGVDLSIDTYQGMQTVKMIKDFSKIIAHPLETFADTASSLLQSEKFRRTLKFSGGKWLEWQYGLRPTIETVYSLTGDLIGAVSSSDGCLTAIAKSSSRDQTRYKGALCSPKDGIKTDFECFQSRRCLIALRCGIDDPTLNSLSQFTSLNPVSFFYENLPFSFVLDWIIDIGGYIRSMETALATGLVFKSGYRTDTTLTTVKASCKTAAYDSYGKLGVPNLQGDAYVKSLRRTVLSSMPLPVYPAIDVNLGSARLASLASLLTNLL